MNKFSMIPVIAGLAIAAAFSSCSKSVSKGPDQPFGEKSGAVYFKPMDMMGIKTTVTLYFDDYGRLEMRESVTEGSGMGGMQFNSHSVQVRDGFVTYFYEIPTEMPDSMQPPKIAYKKTLTPSDLAQMDIAGISDSLRKALDYKDEGTEKVAGLKGSKYSMAPMSFHASNRITAVHYKNIPLKVSMGNMSQEAEKVKFGIKFPADKFKVPAGYPIQDAPVDKRPELPMEDMEEMPETSEPGK